MDFRGTCNEIDRNKYLKHQNVFASMKKLLTTLKHGNILTSEVKLKSSVPTELHHVAHLTTTLKLLILFQNY